VAGNRRHLKIDKGMITVQRQHQELEMGSSRGNGKE